MKFVAHGPIILEQNEIILAGLRTKITDMTTTVIPGPDRVSAPPIRAAFTDSLPVGLGIVSLGIAFGALVVQAGLDWWWATVFSAVIYAGSFEFLLIGLVAALAPLATIATAAFFVNVRHLFYGLSFPLHQIHRRSAKIYSTFALTDEAYALTTTEAAQSWPGRRIVAVQLFMHLYWVTGATLGGLLAGLIPDTIKGLEFALTALFVVLAVDAVRARHHDLATPALALLAAVLARVTFPDEMLVVAFLLFTTVLVLRRLLATKRAPRA
jgi:branched chain amino acid efflux pump